MNREIDYAGEAQDRLADRIIALEEEGLSSKEVLATLAREAAEEEAALDAWLMEEYA